MSVAADSERVPVPAHEWFLQQGLPVSETPPSQTLERVRAPSNVIEEFRPVGSHLEWRLSEHYWATRGVLAFAENRVPYVVNNSGWLSLCIAEMLFASCEATPPPERVYVVELGCGSALFAKLFLDAFKLCCSEHGRDHYERLTYLATDRSPAAVAQWRERRVFAEHEGHVEPLVLDANTSLPAHIAPSAVICNYVLDVLPAAVLRKTEDGSIEQLHARTHLADANAFTKIHGEPTLAELRELVDRDNAESRDRLLEYLPRFDLEVAFLPSDDPSRAMRDACAEVPVLERVLFNHGAIDCLTDLVPRLDPHGFIAINDYGPTQRADVSAHASCQQFGDTTAFGLNFLMLERELQQLGAMLVTPSGDASAALHSRLVSRRALPEVGRVFERHCGESARLEAERRLATAREHAAAGRLDPALIAYRDCLEHSPRDWALLGEVTEFMLGRIRDYTAAVTLAQTALRLNPMYSAWLWNVLGDALYSLERYTEAHEAYLQAERIDPRDPRTTLNLGYSYLQRDQHETALSVLARGLAADTAGAYRERLLSKQAEVLAAISCRALEKHRRHIQRQARLQGLPQALTVQEPSAADSPQPARNPP